MKNEFKRFRLEKVGLITIILQLLGALGLLVGFLFNPVLIISSGGLAALMLLGLFVRLKSRDGFLVSLPALLLCGVNSYICLITLVLL